MKSLEEMFGVKSEPMTAHATIARAKALRDARAASGLRGSKRKVTTHCKVCGDKVITSKLSGELYSAAEVAQILADFTCVGCADMLKGGAALREAMRPKTIVAPDDSLAAMFGVHPQVASGLFTAAEMEQIDVYVAQSRLVGLHYKCALEITKAIIGHVSMRPDFWEDPAYHAGRLGGELIRLRECELCSFRALSDNDLMAHLRNKFITNEQKEVLEFIRKERITKARAKSEARMKGGGT